MYQPLADLLRPTTLDEVFGQDHILAPNGILLYLDEIQSFNRKQQQSLLEHIESGKITLIASTTENPYFYVFNAILSRSTVFEFKQIDASAALQAVKRAVSFMEQRTALKAIPEDGALEYIAQCCGGDLRKAMNAVEVLFSAGQPQNGILPLTLQDAKMVTQKSAMRYDREGDAHFDIASALMKSMRGSDPDAAIFYLAKLLESGDMISACRRLQVIASEDIGLAYPMAASIVKSCVDSAMQLGLPEARIPLAQAVILLATAPKSNSVICAIDDAMSDIANSDTGMIPSHLQDSHYGGAEKLGHGQGYKYPHSFPNHYVKQQYLPDTLLGRTYYKYGESKLEQQTKAYWDEVKNK